MAWLHTWAGLIVGWVLFFVFVTGTVGYFWVELDRWMRPELPRAAEVSATAFVREAERFLTDTAPLADEWLIRLPGSRGDYTAEGGVAWIATDASARERRRPAWWTLDSRTRLFQAEPTITARATGGGYALYQMHKQLHYLPRDWGIWLVCACSMVMLVALVSGVATHRHLLRELFTFRTGHGWRSWLDVHNLAGVVVMPFTLMITLSGLVLFGGTFLPAAAHTLYPGDEVGFEEDLFLPIRPVEQVPRTRRLATALPLERGLAAAAAYWGDDAVREISVFIPGDAGAKIRLLRSLNRTIVRDVELEDVLYFDAVSGDLLERRSPQPPWPRRLAHTLFGLHEGMFAGPGLRWLYFLSGLLGCTSIGTGLVMWTIKRRNTRPGGASFGTQLVERLNIGTIAGLPVAVAVYFWANRLLPAALASRAQWELHSFFIAWAAMFLLAAARPLRSAWTETLWLGAGAFALLPGLNALTTDRHLGVTLASRDWELAAVDLVFLAVGVALGATAMTIRLSRGSRTTTRRQAMVHETVSEQRVTSRRRRPARHRWSVASRAAAAVVGGYGLAWLVATATAALLHTAYAVPRVDAVLIATILSVFVYTGLAVSVFHARSAARAWLGLLAAAVPPLLLLFLSARP